MKHINSYHDCDID